MPGMSSADSLFRQEVPLLVHALPHRLSPTPPPPHHPHSSARSFSLSGKATGILFSSNAAIEDPNQGLHWQIENGSAATLDLRPFSMLSQARPAAALQLAYDVQLFPDIAITRSSSDPPATVTVVGLLSTDTLFFHQLSMHGAAHMDSTAAVSYCDLSAQLGAHGSPTALAATADTILIGCSDGVVLGFAAFPRQEATVLFELQASSWGLNRLISGMFYRAQQPSVVTLLHMHAAPGDKDKRVALALYDDCTLRGLHIARGQVVLSENLSLAPASSSAHPQQHDGAAGASKRPALTFATLCSCAPAHPDAAHDHVLLASFESGSTNAKSHSIFTLALSPAGRLVIQDKHELSGLSPGAVVLSACMSHSDTVWALVREHGLTHVLGFSRSGRAWRLAQLQEQFDSLVVDDASQSDVVMLELWEDVLACYQEQGFSADAQVLAHLLAPSSLCRFSLRDTLACHGAQLTMSEVETCSLEGLAVYIRGAVQTLQRRTPNTSAGQSWLLFLRSYREAWSRRHIALGLVAHPASRQLGCVRAGGMLSLLRAGRDAEILWASGGRGASGTAAPGGADAWAQLQGRVLRDAELQAVHCSVKAVASSLGPLCMDAFVGLLASGVQGSRELAVKFTSLWLNGPPSSSGRSHDDVVRGQHSRWRQQRRLLVLQLGQQLGAVPDPVGALQRYCVQVGLGHAPAAEAGAPEGATSAADAGLWARPVAAAVQQQAYAQCCNLRDCLLLLSIVRQLAAVGTVPLDVGQLHRLEAALAPQLERKLQEAGLSYWLSRTPASCARAAPLDPALSAMEQLTLGNGHAAAPGWQQQPGGGGDIALAAKLLPLALPGLGLRPAAPGGAVLHACNVEAAAERMVAWLQYGGGGGGGAAPPTSSWVLELGFSLFDRAEGSALLPLSRLAGALGTQDGSSDLLRGLSLACSLSAGGGGEGPAAKLQRSAVVEEATSCFFRAVSNLAAAHKPSLPGIVRALRHIVTDLDDDALPSAAASEEPGQQALQQLHFYEVIMMLFERERAPQGALTFAHAALQQLSLLLRSAPLAAQDPSWLALKGRLWSNAFSYNCEMGAFEAAYAAVVANPLPDRALDCLRRLVHELCERNQLLVLCSLPFAGTLSVAGGGVVTLVQEVVQALQRRACNADLLMQPQPYRVLHDFLVSRSELRGAAQAMLALARRLRGEAPHEAAAQALLAYEAAINALSLLKDSDAWLDLSEPWIKMHACPARPLPLLFTPEDSLHGSAGGAAPPAAALAPQEPLGVTTLQQLKREYLLLRCAVTAAKKQPGMDPLQQWAGEDEVFSQLLLAGETETAVMLAHACFSGSALTAALARALGSLAAKCGRLQQNEADLASGSHEGLPGLCELEQRELLMGQAQLGSRAAPHWLLLRQLLQRYEGARTPDGLLVHGGCLRGVVADAVLKVDRRLQLPPWLLDMFREDCLGLDWALLGVYLSHDRLVDAVALVEGQADDWSRTDPRQRRHLAAVWLPHHRIARLRARLSSEVERGSEQGGLLLQRLDAAMRSHLELAAHDSDMDAGSLNPMGGGGNVGLRMLAGDALPSPGSWLLGGSWQGTDGAGDPEPMTFGHSLDALSPPPPSLLWLPPPLESIGS